MTTTPVPGETGTPPAKRETRASVMLSASVTRFGGGEPTRHRVRDLSTGGVRIDQADGLPVGAMVLVSVGALEAVGATVVWIEQGSAGLRFAEPIDPARARAKTAITPRSSAPPPDAGRAGATAGWMPGRPNPYRKP